MNIDRILFFNNVRTDAIVRLASEIFNAYSDREAQPASVSEERNASLTAGYFEMQRLLLDQENARTGKESFWKNYLCHLVEDSENLFSLTAEKGAEVPALSRLAESDLEVLMQLYALDWDGIVEWLDPGGLCVCSMRPDAPGSEHSTDKPTVCVQEALSASDPKRAVAHLAEYYRLHYCGILGKYHAFVWNGRLEGVTNQDPITFDDLVGYQNAQEKLIQNTRVFVDGMPSNNVLLYGDKGTGKSSSVKALLNLFGDRGLRMINMPKKRIGDITDVMKAAAQRACRFIIFIDDLSFEDTETEYKHFKSILEGGVEVQPDNVLIYVTSNRRNLVKETWKDRSDTEGEIHITDGIQERQSLSDRFGLKIPFLAPDKQEFMEIVQSMARKEGLSVDQEVLLREANYWDMRQTSRSGRSAKQFIVHLAGRLAEGSVESAKEF